MFGNSGIDVPWGKAGFHKTYMPCRCTRTAYVSGYLFIAASRLSVRSSSLLKYINKYYLSVFSLVLLYSFVWKIYA